MDSTNDFEIKRAKYMPIFPKATGQPTIYIEGYPFEDDEPMAATLYHAEQEAARAENAEARAKQEAARAENAETEAAQLREQLQRLQTRR